MSGVAERYARGRAAWPDVTLPGGAEAFARHLARHAPAPGDASAAPQHIEDLYLACACAAGSESALLAFDRRYLSQVDHFLPPGDRTPVFLDEIRQVLREKFFVRKDGAPPKIADYSGKGSLHSWVRTATVHAARNLHRAPKGERLHEPDGSAIGVLASGQDPELEYLRQKYRQDFKEVLQAAFDSLPNEQRDVMRLHYLEGLNIDNIGVRLGVNRATVARWRTAARQAILDTTRRLLRERLRLSDSDFDHVARLLRSQIDVSLSQLLGRDV